VTKKHANSLGADQPRHLFNLFDQHLGGIVEQEMRLVEEEHQLGLVGIAYLGKLFEQLAQEPQKKGRIKPRRGHQLIGGKDVDPAATLRIKAHQIGKIQRRFPEKLGAALVFQHQKLPLDRPYRGAGHVAVAQQQIF
jgi:hypothetical protein